ncbi:MAG: hypothetical protein U5K72_15315 [Balneolaceae bacterium]|nr:hypothetical protein [Balneolaceae bacterium]
MPEEGIDLSPKSHICSYEELLQIIDTFIELESIEYALPAESRLYARMPITFFTNWASGRLSLPSQPTV